MKELMAKIGKEGTAFLGGVVVGVRVEDVKVSYGKDRFLITPLNGSGTVWIESDPTK